MWIQQRREEREKNTVENKDRAAAAVKVTHFSKIQRDEDQPQLVQPKNPEDVYTPPPRVPGGILHDANLQKKDVSW